ncbi:OmpA family protein [Reyranella aquatilis]|uniref:OmpA family protein n=1 Tax=Reyranella aquatilis TaxID=2035356 RepID=A0ABS8KY72_9HYPH|nr:OmpA family protein [Reyranella aquatilis]MCC8431015.1 OmpA family protein [Reyranella aquatilis]
MLKKLLVVAAATFLLGACASEPPPPPPPPPPPVQAQTFMVFFDWDRSNLTSQAVDTVRQAAQAYKTRGAANIVATGHTDTSGSPQYNMALSLRRANSVKEQLVREGVPATAITVNGRGEEGLLVQTGDNVREPQNRRVEIVVGGQTTVSTVFSDPASYCKALSDKYRQYRTSQVEERAAAAMAKCDAGDYAAGIPPLEEALMSAKIPLPAPGYRWPGRPVGPS